MEAEHAAQHSRAARARLSGVRLAYTEGAPWSLDGVDLTVYAGERLCVLGPNGAGKSTLAQVLCGLEAPDAGTVELLGEIAFDGHAPHPAAYRAARRRSGLVFQNPEDQIVTSVVADDVAFGPENLGVPGAEIARRVDEELARVGLAAFALADPARLSGGQQQRVALAGALATHPDLLVLDEPGAMLDVRGRRGVMRVLGELQAAGTTIVHITHFMDEALAADRVVVLDHGRIVREGTPREVFAHAAELRELGLDVPLVTNVALELGLSACTDASELAAALAGQGREPHASALGAAEAPACDREATGAGAPTPTSDAAVPAAAATPAATSATGTAAASTNVAASATQAPALKLSHVSFRYGSAPTLHDLSLEVAPGELVALVGQTGSGKSTLAKLACALVQPSAGTVEVCGIPTTDRRRRRELRGKVGYVMQHPERQLFADTVFEDIAFGPRNLGLSEAEVERRVREQLAFLGLGHKAQASPFSLSGGQRRLVALAGVLALEPKVLVLDEPVAGLDPHGAERLRTIIEALHAQGRTILMISHAMEDVAELAGRMVVLGEGRIAHEGTPREVFAHASELCELGLGVPAARALARRLRELGVPVANDPLTQAELVCELARLHRTSHKEAASC